MGELERRIAELEAERDALAVENHDMRESLKVIEYWAQAGLSSRMPNSS